MDAADAGSRRHAAGATRRCTGSVGQARAHHGRGRRHGAPQGCRCAMDRPADDRAWAAAELFATTGEPGYRAALTTDPTAAPGRASVAPLGTITLATADGVPPAIRDAACAAIVAAFDGFLAEELHVGYRIPYAAQKYDWGPMGRSSTVRCCSVWRRVSLAIRVIVPGSWTLRIISSGAIRSVSPSSREWDRNHCSTRIIASGRIRSHPTRPAPAWCPVGRSQ